MENKINNKITYHQEGDYLIPDIKLPEENKLFEHLVDTNDEAKKTSKVNYKSNCRARTY